VFGDLVTTPPKGQRGDLRQQRVPRYSRHGQSMGGQTTAMAKDIRRVTRIKFP